jgi:DNA uptake protein ComE-like DNA-binding protein
MTPELRDTPSRRSRPRRSFVLLAVLIVVGSALLVVTSLLFLVQAEAAGLRGAADEARGRALCWSGVQVIMQLLQEQRSAMLEGEAPRLEPQYVLVEEGSVAGVVRLLPITPGGERLAAEAGRIDLAGADAEGLAATGWLEPELAEAIVRHCDDRGPIQSVADLLRVDGVTPQLMYGPLDALTITDDADFSEDDIATRVGRLHAEAEPRGLADLVTVYAFEPAVQRDGSPRINLNRPWSAEMEREITERFDADTAAAVSAAMSSGTTFRQEGDLFKAMRGMGIDPSEWAEYADAFTTEKGPFHFGRLDINSAPLEALLSLPGIDRAIAGQIVQVRDGLSAAQRASVVWPLLEGVLAPEAYDTLGGRITTRTFTWRVRLAAGEVDAHDLEGPLRQPVIVEVVFDLAGQRPRVAYLRDIALMQTAALVASNATLDGAPEAVRAGEDAEPPEPAAGDDAPGAAPDPAAPGDGTPGDPALPGDADPSDAGDPAAPPPGAAPGSPSPPPAPAPGAGRGRIGRWRRGER